MLYGRNAETRTDRRLARGRPARPVRASLVLSGAAMGDPARNELRATGESVRPHDESRAALRDADLTG
jgi:hypothetical protein